MRVLTQLLYRKAYCFATALAIIGKITLKDSHFLTV